MTQFGFPNGDSRLGAGRWGEQKRPGSSDGSPCRSRATGLWLQTNTRIRNQPRRLRIQHPELLAAVFIGETGNKWQELQCQEVLRGLLKPAFKKWTCLNKLARRHRGGGGGRLASPPNPTGAVAGRTETISWFLQLNYSGFIWSRGSKSLFWQGTGRGGAESECHCHYRCSVFVSLIYFLEPHFNLTWIFF